MEGLEEDKANAIQSSGASCCKVQNIQGCELLKDIMALLRIGNCNLNHLPSLQKLANLWFETPKQQQVPNT